MEIVTLSLAIVLLTLLMQVYRIVRKKSSYWTKMGIKQESPLTSLIQSVNDPSMGYLHEIYNKFPNERFVGRYMILKPTLLVRDPEFIETMFIKDFQYFMDHFEDKEIKSSSLDLQLFALTGNEWRSMRHKLLPSFTTGKLKLMFQQNLPCADEFMKKIENQSQDFSLKDGLSEYTMDVASTVIFGIEIKNEKLRAEFKKYSSELFDSSATTTLLAMMAQVFPFLERYVNFLNVDAEKFFKTIVNDTIEQRIKSNEQRNDYVQLLLKLREQGSIEMKSKDPDDNYLNQDISPVLEHFEMTDDLLAAQAFQFLTAGSDPLVNTLLFFFYELSRKKDIQEKVRSEILDCLEKYGGYNYNSLRNMTYLEQCLQETLRLYPVVSFLSRTCVKDFKVDDKVTIKKGTLISISVLGIHKDPKFYPDPETFDPERFHPDVKRKNAIYLPFGDGPRMCIGMRFATMGMKLLVVKVFERFTIDLSPKSSLPLKITTKNFFLSPENLYFNFNKIN